MSIEEEIKDRVGRGMLYPLAPSARGEPPARAMLVGERLWHELHSPDDDDERAARIGELLADLDVFITGEPLDPKYLFLLYPARDSVWEIRSVRTSPSIRVLGMFAQHDVYVATNFALRKELGGWESREWKNVKRAAGAEWRRLFPAYEPLRSTTVSDLVSGAIDGRYFK